MAADCTKRESLAIRFVPGHFADDEMQHNADATLVGAHRPTSRVASCSVLLLVASLCPCIGYRG
ncbi:MAG: hypothetical protein V2A73_04495 [Pseudomonadota bacterium]